MHRLNSFLKRYSVDKHIYTYLNGDTQETSRAIRSMFPDVPLDKLAKAGGAVPGATAHFSSWTPNHVALRVTVPNEDAPDTPLLSAVRGFHKVGPDIILEHVVQTARGPYRGQGHERFHEQLKHLRELGIKGIHIESGVGTGGPEGSTDAYTGYHVWPRYGFNGDLKSNQIAKLPQHIQRQLLNGNRDFHHLFSIVGGPEAWKRVGSDTNELYFDTHPTSDHSQKFLDYYNKRKQREMGK